MTIQQSPAAVRDMAELGHLVGTVGEYQVFQVVENDPEPSVVRYALLGPSPFMCATFESLKDAMEAAHRLARQLKSETPVARVPRQG